MELFTASSVVMVVKTGVEVVSAVVVVETGEVRTVVELFHL